MLFDSVTEDYSSYESVDEEEPEAPKAKTKAPKKKPVAPKKCDSDGESHGHGEEKPAAAKSQAKTGIKPSASGRALDSSRSKAKPSAAKVGGQGSIMGFFGPQSGKKK